MTVGNSLSLQFSTTIAVVFATILGFAVKLRRRKNFPPGPKPLPFVGNVKDFPTSFEWETFTEWAKQYGDVIHLQMFGSSILVLSSARATKDLLEGRSAIYSCRPKFTMIHDLMGWDWAVQFMQFGPRFKKYRKAVQNQLTPQAALTLRPALEKSTSSLIESIKSSPNDFLAHIQNMTGEMMVSTIYGEQDADHYKQYIHNADEAIAGLFVAGNFGTFLVDIIPALKYIPVWFPGASFQRKAQKWKKLSRDMIDIPYANAKSLASEETSPSIVRSMLSSSDQSGPLDEELVKGTAGVLYLGGADTMLSILVTFVFAMLMHPEVQKRAQAEIDQLLGPGRRPTLEDRPSLPFIHAVYLETLRWHPATPLGVPHRLMENDSYRGYDIPAGATVLVNQWAIFRDEANYKNASKFDPARFLAQADSDKAILDPTTIAFGFGRRRCPGRHFAEDGVWLVMASILAEFDITYAKDKDGKDIIPTEKFISSLVSRPEPFEALFKPRSIL